LGLGRHGGGAHERKGKGSDHGRSGIAGWSGWVKRERTGRACQWYAYSPILRKTLGSKGATLRFSKGGFECLSHPVEQCPEALRTLRTLRLSKGGFECLSLSRPDQS
jgi:hypothetical protein